MTDSSSRLPRFIRPLRLPAVLCCLMTVTASVCHADDGPEPEQPASLTAILAQQTRIAFDKVGEYVKAHPEADDVDQSYGWLFETAQRNGYEADALPLAEAYLEREKTVETTAGQARQLKVLGLAAKGEMENAIEGFQAELSNVRLRSPNATVEFAIALAAQAQMSNDFQAAETVLKELSRAFFLNPYVRSLAENRLYRLELAEQAAPRISVSDFDEKPVEFKSYEGKVLLVDFWATNCAPCLEEFPAMKQLYADFHEKGFEIVGISLDEDREFVDEFQETWKLPWRLAMNASDGGATRTRFHARTIPSMFLIDRKGRVVRIDVRGHNLRRSVEELLKAEK